MTDPQPGPFIVISAPAETANFDFFGLNGQASVYRNYPFAIVL